MYPSLGQSFLQVTGTGARCSRLGAQGRDHHSKSECKTMWGAAKVAGNALRSGSGCNGGSRKKSQKWVGHSEEDKVVPRSSSCWSEPAAQFKGINSEKRKNQIKKVRNERDVTMLTQEMQKIRETIIKYYIPTIESPIRNEYISINL